MEGEMELSKDSQYSQFLVQCDACGYEHTITFPQVIIEQENPEAAQRLSDGELFEGICPECGHVYDLDISVLYADIQKRVLICYFNTPIELSQAQTFIEQRVVALGLDLDKSFVRIASTPNELREKVILLEHGLDDRVIEVLKLIHLDSLRKEGWKNEFDEIRCGVLNDDLLVVDFLGENPRNIEVHFSFYEILKNSMRQYLEQEKAPIVVDFDWAMTFVADSGVQFFGKNN